MTWENEHGKIDGSARGRQWQKMEMVVMVHGLVRIGFAEKVTLGQNAKQVEMVCTKRKAVGTRRLVTEVYWSPLFIH